MMYPNKRINFVFVSAEQKIKKEDMRSKVLTYQNICNVL